MIESLTQTFKYRWKVFLISMAAQFVIAGAVNLGLHSPKVLDFLMVPKATQATVNMVSPLPAKINVLDQIRPKLEQKTNNFHLKKDFSMVQRAYAVGSYGSARSYVAVDFNSGKVLADKTSDQSIPVASLTKIMTAVVALDLASPSDKFTISQNAEQQIPTKIGVVAGQKMSLDELLHASLMTSANDATVAIKDGVDNGYGKGTFIAAMNAKAQFLGLKDTHFDNPVGLDGPNQYSSAEDLAVLSHYALTNYPEISDIAQKDYIYLPASFEHKRFDLYNWNGLLGVYPGVEGLKIGNTNEAGYTTVVVSERGGQKVLAVLLGAPGVTERDLWTANLLDDSFAKLGISPANISKGQLREKYDSWQYWN